MRRFGLLVLLFSGGAALASIVPACSSSGVAAAGDAGDGGIGPNQPANAPCDPALPNACLPGPPCSTVRCDTISLTCVEKLLPAGVCSGYGDGGFFFEASVADSATVSSVCHSSTECLHIPSIDGSIPVSFVCAFPAYEGCSVSGVCVLPEPPQNPDGSVQEACGCDGAPVQYVTGTQTAAPVASAAPCSPRPDAGGDAATDAAADSGVDGAADAGADATVDAPAGD